jgi:hypothetical protein
MDVLPVMSLQHLYECPRSAEAIFATCVALRDQVKGDKVAHAALLCICLKFRRESLRPASLGSQRARPALHFANLGLSRQTFDVLHHGARVKNGKRSVQGE